MTKRLGRQDATVRCLGGSAAHRLDIFVDRKATYGRVPTYQLPAKASTLADRSRSAGGEPRIWHPHGSSEPDSGLPDALNKMPRRLGFGNAGREPG